MKRFHISNETVRRCRAQEGNCPLNNSKDDSDSLPHFDNKWDAQEYLESILEKKYSEHISPLEKFHNKYTDKDFSKYVISNDKVIRTNKDTVQFDNGLIAKRQNFGEKAKQYHQKVDDLVNKSLSDQLSSDELKELKSTVESLWKPSSHFVKELMSSVEKQKKNTFDYAPLIVAFQAHNDVKNGWKVGTTAKYNRIAKGRKDTI